MTLSIIAMGTLPLYLAYIGPGAGLSALGALLALVFAVIVAAFGFVWYPIRRLLKGRRKEVETESAAE